MNRRNFIKSAFSTVALGTMFSGSAAILNATNEKKNQAIKFGCAGFTFHKYSLDDALKMMDRLNIRYMSLKDFHLPINANDEKIAEVLSKFKNKNIIPYTVGPIYMKSEEAVIDAFSYAQKVGVKLIIAVPDYHLLPLVEEKVKEYDFKVAIHIHGPDTKVYPDAADVIAHVENLDSRIGICYDIGHTVRMGHDLLSDFEKYHTRIYDIHLKDVNKNNRSGHCVEGGRGIIDFKKFFSLLIQLNYNGIASIEYEKDMSDVLPGLAETIGYFNGILS